MLVRKLPHDLTTYSYTEGFRNYIRSPASYFEKRGVSAAHRGALVLTRVHVVAVASTSGPNKVMAAKQIRQACGAGLWVTNLRMHSDCNPPFKTLYSTCGQGCSHPSKNSYVLVKLDYCTQSKDVLLVHPRGYTNCVPCYVYQGLQRFLPLRRHQVPSPVDSATERQNRTGWCVTIYEISTSFTLRLSSPHA